jgi:hypothetical protein
MSKSKPDSSRTERTKQEPRDQTPEHQREKSWRPTDENFDESDGAVDEEMEFDTSKYEAPRNR